MVLKRLVPASLAGRTLAAVGAALLLLYAVMAAIHDVLLHRMAERATEEILAQQISNLMDAVAAAPEWERDTVAHGLSRPYLEVHWLPAQVPDPWRDDHVHWLPLEGRIRQLSRFSTEVRIGSGAFEAEGRRLVGTAAVATFADGSHLLLHLVSLNRVSADSAAIYGYAAAAGMLVLLIAGLAVRSAVAPLTSLAAAVQQLSPDEDHPPHPESGPTEIRLLERRLNDLAGRIRSTFRQRTMALAALSHDLMSPLSRLRLRVEELPEDGIRVAMQRDLAEIETMVGDVLAYLRSDHEGEPWQALHLTSLVHTIVDQFAQAGVMVIERRIMEAVMEARPVALKRAIVNLVGNAARHGRDPWIEVEATADAAIIRVGDHGPGIPAQDLPHVMEPFFRGDRARASGGGSGLGLPTARATAEEHGGSLEIANGLGGGAISTLRLPHRISQRPTGPTVGETAV